MASPQLLFCDEDEDETEVFFGSVSEREMRRAAKYDRRTVLYKPEFRKDTNLMRYTMDQLQLLSLDRGSDARKCGSEGTDSCGSQSPLGSSCSSQGQSPLGIECGIDPPLTVREPLNSYSKKAGVVDVLVNSKNPDRSCDPEAVQTRSHVTSDPCDNASTASCTSEEKLPYTCLTPRATAQHDKATNDVPSERCTPAQVPGCNERTPECFLTNRPILRSPSAFASHSPLMNVAGNVQHLPLSPRPLLGSIDSSWASDVTYQNVFPDNSPVPTLSRMLPDKTMSYLASGTQEVPTMMTPGEKTAQETEFLSPCPTVDGGLGYDMQSTDIPNCIGNVTEASAVDLNESDINDSFQECHLVPDVELSPGPDTPASENRRVSLLKGRSGVTFTEKQFSPTLTVKASPPRALSPETLPDSQVSPLPTRKLFLDLSSCPPLTESEQRQVPQSPECLSEVTFSMTVDPQATTPRRSRVKRLSPVRSPKAAPSDSRSSSSVFDRLYGRRKTPQSENQRGSSTSRTATARSSPGVKKGDGVRRSHSTSKLSSSTKPTVKSQSTYTPPAARRGLTFSGLDPARDRKPQTTPKATKNPRQMPGSSRSASAPSRHSGSREIKVAGKGSSTTKNKGLCTPPHRADTPKYSTPSVPPVYRKGTPRYTGSHKALNRGPVPKLNLDCCSTGATDISRLDDSIQMLEREMEQEQAEKDKVNTPKNKLRKKGCESPTAYTPTRSAPPSRASPKLPKVRFNNKQALSLSEPELDAITLVHTLCNSQQVAKLVKKARATNVVKQVFTPKPASKVHWKENLVEELEYEDNEQDGCRPQSATHKPILTIRSPGHYFPYNDQPLSPIVVTKGTKKFTGFGKDLNIT